MGLMKAVEKFEYEEDINLAHMQHGGLDKLSQDRLLIRLGQFAYQFI